MNGEIRKGAWLDKWHVAPSNTKSYDFLDGIRGIAILMVVACHLLYVNPTQSEGIRLIFGFFAAGTYGVTVFFALSGFLISLPFWKHKANGTVPNLLRYAKRRFWKIAPPLALSILLLTPIYVYLHGNSAAYWDTAFKWLTGQAFVIPVSGKLNPVMWSIIVEVHFYVLLPLLFLCLRKLSYPATLRLLFLMFLLIPPLARWIYSSYGQEFSIHPLIKVHFPSMLDPFAAGILVAGLYQSGKLRASIAKCAPLGLFGLIIALWLSSWAVTYGTPHAGLCHKIAHLLVILSTGLLLTFVANPQAASRWFLDNPVLRWLGIISYEWYLLHQALFWFTWKILGNADGSVMIYLTKVMVPGVISLILAAIFYRFFSLPILVATRGRDFGRIS